MKPLPDLSSFRRTEFFCHLFHQYIVFSLSAAIWGIKAFNTVLTGPDIVPSSLRWRASTGSHLTVTPIKRLRKFAVGKDFVKTAILWNKTMP